MKTIGLMMTLLCITSCSQVSTNYVPLCAPVKEYTKAQEVEAAKELMSCPCPEVKEMMKDGYVLRQSNRECQKAKD